jgi:hypothetical protein
MTSKNVYLSEEGLRRLIQSSNSKSLKETSPEFGRDILWTISKTVELPVVLDEKGEGSLQPLTLIGIPF